MDRIPLYPMRFEPIYQYRLWGGRRLASLLSAPLPDNEPIGEAWILSDREDHASVVADGMLKGRTLGHLLEQGPENFLGKLAGHYKRFPLLMKFLDVSQGLSVQVHPSDAHKELIPAGDTGKTEAWVVLEKGPDAHIYAGLKPGTTEESLRQAISSGEALSLAALTPSTGQPRDARVVTLAAPPTLLPLAVGSWPCAVSYDLDSELPKSDVVMMLRVQQERMNAAYFPSVREYSRRYGLDATRMARLPDHAIVMHPGPMNRGVEIAAEVADSSRSTIVEQVANGVTTRMAVLYLLLGGTEFPAVTQ